MVNKKLKETTRSINIYSESFKKLVVLEYESGSLNKDQLRQKYGIKGNGCIPGWLKKYGKLAYPTYKSIGRPMKDTEQQIIKELKASLREENKILEKKLAEAELQLAMYKKFVEIAERELNIEIKKKVWCQAVQEIALHFGNSNIANLCKLFGYTKQAFYKRRSNSVKESNINQQVKEMVLDIRYKLPGTGVRKLHFILRENLKRKNLKVGRDKLFGILRSEQLLICKRRRYTKTTNSRHWMRKYPNLTRDMELTGPEQLWVSDITYLQTTAKNEYLHLVTDAGSKQIMGYEICGDMKTESTMKALEMAINKREYDHQLTHHSDRGLQYCSSGYVGLLLENDIRISMTENGDPYENAVAERVNGILKDEFGLDSVFENSRQLHKQVHQAIEAYNKIRPHLSIGLLTPRQAHSKPSIKVKRWKSKRTIKNES
ncbi:MAG: IS3 family transposase [Sphingobacteriaceae bacterium]|nr:IS3 family transposase [Sphingobacteriaceae bacterium]